MGAVPARVHRFGRGARAYGAHLTFSRQRISLATTHGGPVIFSAHPIRDAISSLIAIEDRIAAGGQSPLRPRGPINANRGPLPAVTSKAELRKSLRKARREHVAAQPDSIRALLFHRPPAPLLAKIGASATIGLYHATDHEAPTGGYAKFFHEAGHIIALPHFVDEQSPMAFRRHTDPFAGSDLEQGLFGLQQPSTDAPQIKPDVLFVPLIGFTADGDRLGQGGGHYDRWLAEHPGRMTIGLAWDVQLCDALPTEPHDVALDAIVTPTRMYGID